MRSESACRLAGAGRIRSEERRVGSECGSRAVRYLAEDGIRDVAVTGVQTCALPIYAVTPGYFDAMGIPLKAGRLFTDADRIGAPEVVLLNETAARQLYPDGNAIGKRLQVGGSRPY